ncbi:PTS system sucrose-specific IIC component [Pseudoclavibacter sp. JAI123]|uniref:glucose PTS transporter subunit IIA n=1 Tax=Pseudoclavibacter sp. JAI123 TaxID=2723065 RepID=UPI0015CAE9E0|nr:glucose PTS transporter subunit IIA [Pseudoclavibacter sp. JAI123]NYF11990.1 PTS system sucrose-specific IIC component [Pseudoclavibacter sp. JAI123]
MSANDELASELLRLLGGAGNVAGVENCMTRMRVSPVDRDLIDETAIKSLPGVLGVVDDDTYQVVLGPGKVTKVTDAFRQHLGAAGADADALAARGAAIKAGQKQRNNTPFKNFIRKIANIFVPLIPALIGAGIVAAVRGLLVNWVTVGTAPEFVEAVVPALTVIGSAFFAFLPIFAGINAAKEFGGTPALGGAVAAIIVFAGISDVQYSLPVLGDIVLAPGQGGVIGAIFAAGLCAWIERSLRGKIPDAIDILVTPTLALLISGLATIFVFMFVAGNIASAIGTGAIWLLSNSGLLAGFVLGGLFLPLVMLGLHQALIPIHATLIEQVGFTPLLTILAMAGAGQVGAALAIYFKLNRNKSLRTTIKGALPVGILGVGEPLIYAVTLPLGRPFLTACLGGAVGGAVAGAFNQFAGAFGATAIGPSGWALLPLLQSNNGQGYAILAYVVGLLAGYISGFLITYFWGFTPALLAEHNAAQADDQNAVLENEAAPVAAAAAAGKRPSIGQRIDILAPVEGRVIRLSEVEDEAFSAGTMGDGFAVEPTSGEFRSPVAGTITALFPTGHAFGVTTLEGLEVLVHIGLGTVDLRGEGFDLRRAEGDVVEVGDVIVVVDLDAVRGRVRSLATPVVVLNGSAFPIVERRTHDGPPLTVEAAEVTSSARS